MKRIEELKALAQGPHYGSNCWAITQELCSLYEAEIERKDVALKSVEDAFPSLCCRGGPCIRSTFAERDDACRNNSLVAVVRAALAPAEEPPK